MSSFHKSHFEQIFSVVDLDLTNLAFPVKKAKVATIDESQVNRVINRTDDSTIAIRQQVLDVGSGRKQEHTAGIPSTALDS